MTHTENVKRTEVESDLSAEGVIEISAPLRQFLADVFTPYIKTKSFHWRITGRQFRDYHILLDEHADQIFATTDEIAERGRKIGDATTYLRAAHSICEAHNGVATASLIEVCLDQTERRTWFLSEILNER